ncbi:MAG: hypothetical protein GY712_03685 [Oceanicoccus sp.]|uniref:hypothetical protein n=1 Tax=Oceanicoccus sp. TaxID=2691044 RepID=UPI002635796B|nr:hypothetical protein [Oceanicoccus sp.]MCP3907097.1 hypothetical protein [Oceanicoccus sp.]
MPLIYYPEQPRETRYIGFDKRQLLKRHQQFRKAGMVLLAVSLILAAVSLML